MSLIYLITKTEIEKSEIDYETMTNFGKSKKWL